MKLQGVFLYPFDHYSPLIIARKDVELEIDPKCKRVYDENTYYFYSPANITENQKLLYRGFKYIVQSVGGIDYIAYFGYINHDDEREFSTINDLEDKNTVTKIESFIKKFAEESFRERDIEKYIKQFGREFAIDQMIKDELSILSRYNAYMKRLQSQ